MKIRVCLVLGALALCSFNRIQAAPAPNVPPLTLPSPAGLVVDDYDAGLFSGAFEDDKGSSLDLQTVRHADGKNGSFLHGTFNIVASGAAGFWNVPGRNWDGKQDWSKVKTLSFLGWASRPLDLRFVIKSDGERQYETRAHLHGGAWEKIELPARDWKNIAAGVGIVSGLDVHIEGEGRGEFALDELRADGAEATGQFGQKIELDPKIVFARSLVPPKERSHKTFVVDAASGNDAGAGDQSAPFKTIARAARGVLPGDIVLVKEGTYEENAVPGSVGLLIDRSGAPDAWIRFKAFPGQRPRLTSSSWSVVSIKEAAYIEFSGFEVTSTRNPTEGRNVASGIGMDHAHHILVRDNIVHDCGGGGIGSGYSDYLQLRDNLVHDNAFFNPYNCSGLSLWEGRDFDAAPGPHNIIEGNIAYRNENKGPTTQFGGKLTDGNGIIIDFNRGSGQTLIQNNQCFDNGGRGIHIFHSQNVLVRRNTLVGNNRTPDSGSSDLRANSSENVRFERNIVVGRNGNFEPNIAAKNVVYTNNILWNYARADATTIGVGNTIADPQFVNPSTEARMADFHLKAGSPARGEGAAQR